MQCLNCWRFVLAQTYAFQARAASPQQPGGFNAPAKTAPWRMIFPNMVNKHLTIDIFH
jgi:hypothetical protein